ncbi:hypothetical protein LMG26857_03645 [Achromobacter anxifer]|uniref:hypothetical protein n=1 Tax=Achromobacter anxifer TaxID=1287737 RepID=UPI00155D0B62|nr:hypothetical protein [Achromobacter anxifer]CAB5514586.1 hypothetical protein LMG26857_03645 [Achromobacter anxifer]
MTFAPIPTTDTLRAALPSMSTEQLLDELQHAFGYHGNAVHNAQPERVDDSIARFNAIKMQLAARLAA